MFTQRQGWRSVVLLVCLSFLGVEQAAAVTPEDEFDKRIRTSQNIQPLGETPFGENINLYNGVLNFRQLDIDQPGTGLPIQLMRTFDFSDSSPRESAARAFADWRLEIPSIQTLTTSENQFFTGNRCSEFGKAPSVVFNLGRPAPVIYNAEQWWGGYQLIIPGIGRQDLLRRDASNTLSPQMVDAAGTQMTFPIVTRQHWMVTCLAQTSNGQGGQGFLVISPEGTKYWMDWLIYRGYDNVGFAQPGFGGVARRMAMMMASRVEDRFGNSLSYQYDGSGNLVKIQASDGRLLTLNYEAWQGSNTSEAGNRITTATLQASDTTSRTWTYSYGALSDSKIRLTTVTQPDGSSWGMDFSGLSNFSGATSYVNYDPYDGCTFNISSGSGSANISLRHPSGLVGVFTVGTLIRGRSYVPYLCDSSFSGIRNLEIPNVYKVIGNVLAKRVSGPGVPEQSWTYSYSGPNNSWSKDCSATCATTVWTDAKTPAGAVTRYTFSNRYDSTESQLARVENYSAAIGSTLLRSEDSSYAASSSGPWPKTIGSVLLNNINNAQVGSLSPLSSRVISQDSTLYTYSVSNFDVFGRPIVFTRYSPWHRRSDSVDYSDNTAKWILAQIAKRTNSDTGLVESQVDYDASTALPVKSYAFGKLRQTLAYNADGTLATVADGKNNVTAFSSWKRGVPQSIRFADNTLISASVNDHGWITAVTDENGYTTNYGYDTMGRMASIAYPSNDSVAWNGTTQAFERVNDSEYGLAAGHWRQTIATGNARKQTYYDAYFRPLVTREYDTAQPDTTQRFRRFAYDEQGRVIFASYPGTTDSLTSGFWTGYDVLGRTTSTSQDSELGLLTTLTEYLAGNQTRVTNPRGQKTLTGYQVFDRPAYDKPVWIQHPEGAYTDFSLDVFGKPSWIRRRNADASQSVARSYVYDGNQQLCKTIEPEIGAAAAGYDAAGNLAWTASGLNLTSASSCDASAAYDSGRRIDRTYDARNRLKTLTFPDGNGNQSWTYSSDGIPSQVVTLNDAGASQVINAYSYNKRRLLTGESLQQSGSTLSLGYGYDANGAFSGISYPTGLYVDYAPNALGQPTKAGSYASGVSYYPNGGMKQFTYGNGLVHAMTQNARQLPTQISDGNNVLNNSYTYDSAGNVTQIVDGLNNSNTRTMSYDGLDRLSQAASSAFGGDGTLRYTYDALDNMRSAKLTGVKQHNYIYDGSNRLSNVTNDSGGSTIGLSYDTQGNLSNKNGQAFQFDYGNRLRNVPNKESYRYDADGRRVMAASSTLGNILSLYGKDGVLRFQDDARRSKQIVYVSLNGSLVARVTHSLRPLAPTVSAPGYNGGGSYTVSWSMVDGASRYEVEEQAAGGTWQSWYSGTGSSKAVSGKGGGSYSYHARACNSGGCGDWSAVATVSVELAPTGSPGLSVPSLSGNGSYTVSWGTVAGATSYNLEESSNGGSSWINVYSGGGTSQSFSGKGGGSFSYRAKACNPAGCGGYSGVSTVQVTYPPASAPTLSGGGTSSNGSYTLSWTGVATATTYTLEQSNDGGSSWAAIQASASTSLSVSGKANGSYVYRVNACNVSGCSGYSGSQTVTVAIPPPVPSNLRLVGKSPTGTYTNYTATWSPVSGATRYELGGAAKYSGTATSYGWTQSGPFSSVWQVEVRACNAFACSSWSASVSGVKQ